ncbi:hypothetical protein A2U01_0098789 [Trifolium medium]|nr:hypothetical protein [Trifolium medium]
MKLRVAPMTEPSCTNIATDWRVAPSSPARRAAD